jgi:hypothetical protein
MSLSIINKITVGKLFISNNQNFLVKEILEVNDETESVIATLTNSQGEEVFFTGGFSQWFEGLIQ